MIASRTRATQLAERNEAIREVLGERGRVVWTRRLLSLCYHGWKDLPLVPKPLVLTSHLPLTKSLPKLHLTGGSHCLASSRLNW